VIRRRVLLVAGCLLPVSSRAQSAFVGQWQGEVDGIGKALLIVTAIKPNGQVEGRMAFELRSFFSTFTDTADSITNTSYGLVSGPALTIDSALGGRYDLVRSGDQLSGIYSRGTTLRSPATFRKD